MTLDLYYSNFTNVGDGLEKMYQTFLLDDLKVTSKQSIGNTSKAQENGKVQVSLEKMTITKKTDEVRRPLTTSPQKLRIQIRKPEPLRNGSTTPVRSAPTTPVRSGPTTPIKNPPKSPLKISPPQRNPSMSPKKVSPQELRSRRSPQSKNGSTSSLTRHESTIERAKVQSIQGANTSDVEQNSSTNSETPSQNDENILRQQNSRSSTPSSTAPSAKYKVNKVYFREENVENLTWNGETSYVEDPEDPDAANSPKVNPYSSSFLNFLSSN